MSCVKKNLDTEGYMTPDDDILHTHTHTPHTPAFFNGLESMERIFRFFFISIVRYLSEEVGFFYQGTSRNQFTIGN